jgi:hypothetical protein
MQLQNIKNNLSTTAKKVSDFTGHALNQVAGFKSNTTGQMLIHNYLMKRVELTESDYLHRFLIGRLQSKFQENAKAVGPVTGFAATMLVAIDRALTHKKPTIKL